MTDKTRKALGWFEMFYRRDGEDSNDCFERVAAVFHRDTGYLRPGKDCRMHSCEERAEAWNQWVAKNLAAARAALAAPVVEDAQTEVVPPEVQLTPEEAAILKRALWKSVKVLAPAPTQPPTQLDTDSDDAKGLAAPPGYWHGHNAAQDVLASVMETELATYRAEVVALIGRGAALEAEVERLRIALATVTTRPPAVEAEPVEWPSYTELLDKMSELDPNWNAAGTTRGAAVALASRALQAIMAAVRSSEADNARLSGPQRR